MLSPDALKKIDQAIAKYPPEQKQSAVMGALIIAQDEKGWLSTETMDAVAKVLVTPQRLPNPALVGRAGWGMNIRMQ